MTVKNKPMKVFLSLRPAFYLAVIALVLVAVGLAYHVRAYTALGYDLNRFTIVYSVTVMALMAFLSINSVIAGNQFANVFIFAGGAVFSIMAGLLHISRTLANIGVYFTVNMGNAEANAAGVPPAIIGTVMYVVAAIVIVIAAFFKPIKEGGSVLEVIGEDREAHNVG